MSNANTNKDKRAAIIAVGTEITSGQITNSNAAWISAKLKSKGLITHTHLTVPDHKQLILDALQFCSERSHLIFVTGGLGPTSDDFTRDLISQWTQSPLKFDESSWQHIQNILNAKKIPVHDIQKQQCYFPEGARVLENKVGTANGFYLNFANKDIFVLPGPPREIEALWNSEIQEWLDEYCQDLDPYITVSWDTTGKGESFIARIVEEIIKDSNFEIGYRVHLPFVEVKLSYFKSQEKHAEIYAKKIESALKEFIKTPDVK